MRPEKAAAGDVCPDVEKSWKCARKLSAQNRIFSGRALRKSKRPHKEDIASQKLAFFNGLLGKGSSAAVSAR
jgi:hypothetical protein